MKRLFRSIALILVCALVVGTVPVSASEDGIPVFGIAGERSDIKLYLGGALGQKEDGTPCRAKDRYRISRIVDGFDPDSMDIKLSSSDEKVVTTSNKKDKVYAKSIGNATITISIYKKTGTDPGASDTEKLIGTLEIKVIVKKNAKVLRYAVIDSYGNAVDLSDKVGINTPYTVVLSRRGDSDLDGDGKNDIEDTDYRILSCDDTSVKMEPANKYLTAYTVTFTKAGNYTLKAGSYQSKKYPKLLLLEEIEVEAGYEAKSVVQSGLDSVKVGFKTNVTGLTAESFKAYYLAGETKVYPSLVRKVECSGDTATVSFLSDFIQGYEYYIEYNGEKAGSFKASTITADSITSIEIPVQKIEAGVSGLELEYRLLNDAGIDCKTLLGSTLNGALSFEILNGDIDTYVTSGKTPVIYMGTADKSFTVKATYSWVSSTGDLKTVTGQGNIVSVKPTEWVMGTVTGVITAVDADLLIDEDNNINTELEGINWTMDDAVSGAVLQIAVPYTKDGKTVYEGFDHDAGVNKYTGYTAESSDATVVMLASPVPNSQKWVLTANKPGTASIIIYGTTLNGGKVAVGAVPIEVREKKVPTTFTVTPNKNMLNEAYAGDVIKFTVTLKDQYGGEMEGEQFIVENANVNDGLTGPKYKLQGKKSAKGRTGKYFYLYGDEVISKPGALNLKFICGELSQTVLINCGDEDETKTYVLKLSTNTLYTSVKEDTKFSYCDILLEGRTQSGFATEGVWIYFLDAAPISGEAASATGMGQNPGVKYGFTVSKDGSIKTKEELKNFGFGIHKNCYSFVAVDNVSGAAVKLEKGKYTITAYKVENDGTHVIASVIGKEILTVKDNQIMPVVTRLDNAERLESVLTNEDIAKAFGVSFNGSGAGFTCAYNFTVDGTGKTAYVAGVDVSVSTVNFGDLILNIPIDILVRTIQ